jgi:Tfp pilus assembly protein PilN
VVEVPGELGDAWSKVTDAGDSLAALAGMAVLRETLARWEASLARDALADGASWTTIGQALGTSRQAAWERLRPGIAAAIEADRRRVEEQKAKVATRRGAAK